MTSSDFIRETEQCLIAENTIIGKYLNKGSLYKFENAIVQCTFVRHMAAVLENDSSGLLFLLTETDHVEQASRSRDLLRLMCASLLRVANGAGINAMAQIFRQYIRLKSSVIVESVVVETATEKEGVDTTKLIMELHVHMKGLIANQFNGSSAFTKALKDEYQGVVNSNINKIPTCRYVLRYVLRSLSLTLPTTGYWHCCVTC